MLKLNLVRLVMMFTSRFDSSDPRETINYLYSLRWDGELYFLCSILIVLCFLESLKLSEVKTSSWLLSAIWSFIQKRCAQLIYSNWK